MMGEMISVLSLEGRFHISCLSLTSASIRVKKQDYILKKKHFTNVKSLKNRLKTEELTKTNKEILIF